MADTSELSDAVTAIDNHGVHSQPAKSSPSGWLLLVLVFVMSALYMAQELRRGWIPSDEGTLALSAERVLQGELPHRDYQETYTGGLSYLNAAAFRIFGTNLASMRYVLFIFFLAWVPAFHYAASRFVSPPLAAATTLLAVAWGLPNYAAAMPSWYNLFFATFGLAALLRYLEVQSGRWLVVAGICGGISILFKMTGLYFVAGTLLFLAFHEQMGRSTAPSHRRDIVLYRAFLVLSLFSYEALLFALLRKKANAATYLYFWLPNLVIGATIVWYEFYVGRYQKRRFFFLFRELALLGVGIALPIAMFLTPYFLAGSLSEFLADLLIQPRGMILSGSVKPPVFFFVLGVLVDLIVIGGTFVRRPRSAQPTWEVALLAVPSILLIATALVVASRARVFYVLVWSTIWALAPLVVVCGVALLACGSLLERIDLVRRQQLFLTLCATAACSLIQFPFTNTIYFCYVAPLVLLSVTAVVSLIDHPPRLALASAMCFCLLYAVFEMTPGFIYDLGRKYSPEIQTVKLNLARAGGLRIDALTAREYEKLDSLIRQHARGEYILAANRCPEVYFLYGRRSPNRDFFGISSDFGQGPEGVLATLQAHHINLVVLNHEDSIFVQPVPDDLHSALEREFPNRADAGDFEVRWKPEM